MDRARVKLADFGLAIEVDGGEWGVVGRAHAVKLAGKFWFSH